MFSLRHEIGQEAGPYSEKVTQERIIAFCRAVGSVDERSAPPTFLTIFRKGEFDLFQKLGFDLAQVLHAEQEYAYEGLILAGDTIEFKTGLTQVLEKQTRGAFLQFLTFETAFFALRGTELIRMGHSKTKIVIRGAISG